MIIPANKAGELIEPRHLDPDRLTTIPAEDYVDPLWLDCGPIVQVKRVGRYMGAIALWELSTPTHRIEVWMSKKDQAQSTRGTLYYAASDKVVWVHRPGRKTARFLAPEKRAFRPTPGEWRRWAAAKWYTAGALWAQIMGLESFQVTMEYRAAVAGRETNMRQLSVGFSPSTIASQY